MNVRNFMGKRDPKIVWFQYCSSNKLLSQTSFLSTSPLGLLRGLNAKLDYHFFMKNAGASKKVMRAEPCSGDI